MNDNQKLVCLFFIADIHYVQKNYQKSIDTFKQVIDGTHKKSKNWQKTPESEYKRFLKDTKEKLKKSEIDLTNVKIKEKNFFGDFRKIRSEIK